MNNCSFIHFFPHSLPPSLHSTPLHSTVQKHAFLIFIDSTNTNSNHSTEVWGLLAHEVEAFLLKPRNHEITIVWGRETCKKNVLLLLFVGQQNSHYTCSGVENTHMPLQLFGGGWTTSGHYNCSWCRKKCHYNCWGWVGGGAKQDHYEAVQRPRTTCHYNCSGVDTMVVTIVLGVENMLLQVFGACNVQEQLVKSKPNSYKVGSS